MATSRESSMTTVTFAPSDGSLIDAPSNAFSVRWSMLCMTMSSLHDPDTLIVFGPGTCCSIFSAPPMLDRAPPFRPQSTESVAALTAPADIRSSRDKQRLSPDLKRDIGPPRFCSLLTDTRPNGSAARCSPYVIYITPGQSRDHFATAMNPCSRPAVVSNVLPEMAPLFAMPSP